MLEQLIEPLAKNLGIDPSLASSILEMASKMLLQKEDPNVAANLLSKLPSEITDRFSSEEKEQFTKTQQDVSLEDILKGIGGILGTNDKERSLKATEEAANMLQKHTGDDKLFQKLLSGMKRV